MADIGQNRQPGNGRGAAGGQTRSKRDLTVGDYANGVPNIRVGEVFRSFARQLVWMVPLILIGTGVAWFATKDFKRVYEGDGRVLVQLGSEYIYESVSGEQSAGLTQTPDHIVLNEVGIMKNSDLIVEVTGALRDEFGEKRLAESLYASINAAPAGSLEEKNARVDLYRFMDKQLVIVPKPKSSVVDIIFKHEDPDVAVRGVSLFIDAYLRARRELFVEGSSDIISERRAATEDQLNQNEVTIQSFLTKHGISDFASEQAGAQKRTEDLRASLNLLRAQISETEAALATVETQLRQTPETIDLYVDDRAAQRVAQAELELKQLLAKYLPTSSPVRQKQAEISRLKEISVANGGKAAGGRRVGPNTVYQTLLTRGNELRSNANAFREKEFTLQRQLDSVDAKVRRLSKLAPTFANLQRDRSTLDVRLKGYTNKEQEALINQQQAQANSDNVRVISISNLPRKGRNLRMVMFVLGAMGWAFTVFMAGLLKIFLDPNLYAEAAAQDRRVRRRMTDYVPQVVPVAVPEPVRTYAPAPTEYAEPVAYQEATFVDPTYENTAHQSGYYANPNPNLGATGYSDPAYTDPAYPAQQPYYSGDEAYAQAAASGYYGNTAVAYDAVEAPNPYLQRGSHGTVPASEDG